MEDLTKDGVGEALSREICAEIEGLGLADSVTALYVLPQRAVRLQWYDVEEVLDVPANAESVRRLRAYLQAYARSKQRRRVVAAGNATYAR